MSRAPSPSRPRVLAVLGHPSAASFCAGAADAYLEGAAARGCATSRLDLGALDFDPILRQGFEAEQPLEPDLAQARAAIEAADHVAWVFPTWWAGPPALVRGFVDRTFLPGWGFRYEEGAALPKGLMAGRSARMITTMDSPRYWYWLAHGRAVHRAFITGTLRFVGFGPVRETTIHSLRDLDEGGRAKALARVQSAGDKDAQRLLAGGGRKLGALSAAQGHGAG